MTERDRWARLLRGITHTREESVLMAALSSGWPHCLMALTVNDLTSFCSSWAFFTLHTNQTCFSNPFCCMWVTFCGYTVDHLHNSPPLYTKKSIQVNKPNICGWEHEDSFSGVNDHMFCSNWRGTLGARTHRTRPCVSTEVNLSVSPEYTSSEWTMWMRV